LATDASAIALGRGNIASNDKASAIGFSNSASGLNTTAVGYNTKTTVDNSFEIGYWVNSTTRDSSIRGQNGGISLSLPVSADTPLTDGGTTKGSEADGTLPREMYSARLTTGGELVFDVNDGGSVVTKDFANPEDLPVEGSLTLELTGAPKARWTALDNGVKLEVWSALSGDWITQVEYTED
jgi:hypothetical protein